MSVLRCYQQPNREGTAVAQRNNLLYEIIGRKYKVTHFVETTTAADGSNVVLRASAAGVPQIGQTYDFFNDLDEVATCTEVNCLATSNPRMWKVESIFDTDRIIAMVTDNPLNQPAELSWTFEPYERALVRDVFGNMLGSSSKNAYDPPYMSEKKKPILHIVRNEAEYEPELAKVYTMKCNQVTVLGYDPIYVRINSITGDQRLANGILHFQVHYELEMRPDIVATGDGGFWIYALDQDWRDVKGRLFTDKRTGAPLSNQTPLNGRGYSIFSMIKAKVGGIGITNVATGMVVVYGSADDKDKYPPPPKAEILTGITPGPDWYFDVQIADEIVTVTAGSNGTTWTILRGRYGTTAAAHLPDVEITLLPYFRRYLDNGWTDYAPLALPLT